MSFQVQIVWNREFHWVNWRNPYTTLEQAKIVAIAMIDSGDGNRVKKAQIVDSNSEEVIVPSYKIRS